jgi:hypothetical protein
VFSVDTEEDAQAAIIRYCVRRYDGSHRWTDWPYDLDGDKEAESGFPTMNSVTDELRRWWDARKTKGS